MCSCVLVKVERSARQQEACCGEVKQAVEKRKGFGLRRQSRLELHCQLVLTFMLCMADLACEWMLVPV